MVFILDKYKCTERVSVPNMNRMIKHLGKQPDLKSDEKKYNEFQLLKKIKKRAGKDGSYEVNFSLKDYDTANTRALGRLYPAGASLQYLCKEYRKALVHQEYTDIDIKNAHPSLINQVFKKENIECKMLNEYVENRDKYLEVANKTEWTALLNNRIPNESASDLEKEYWNDIISCATKLFDRPYYNTYLEKGEKKNPTNKIGWAISQLATDKERETVSVAMEKLDSFGYELGTLIHDGFLVCDLNVKDGDLREAEKYAEEKTGFSIELVKKSLTDFNHEEVFGEEDDKEITEEDLGDRGNAKLFYEYMEGEGHRFLRCEKRDGGGWYWYNPKKGIWGDDEGSLRGFMDECPVLEHKYRTSTHHQNALMVQLKSMTEIDDELHMRYFNTTKKKLAFQNGIYDFDTKKLIPFSHEYFFVFKAPINLELDKYAGFGGLEQKVKKKFFEDVYDEMPSEGVPENERRVKSKFVLQSAGRTMAGMRDQVVYFVIGRGNSGKSTMCDMMSRGFGGFARTCSLSSFGCTDERDEKNLMWLVDKKYARFLYATEDKNVALEAGAIKTFSGKTDKFSGRSLYERAQEFNHLANLWAFCNTHPKIAGQKSAEFYEKRDRTIETEYQFELPDSDKYKEEEAKGNAYLRKADANLDDFCARPDVVEAFVALVVKSFVPKEADVKIPKCVVESREEWTGEDNFDAKIGELFERGGPEDVLTPREIGEHAQEYCEDAKDFNKNLIGRTLTALGYKRERKPKYIKRLGKTDRCYLSIKKVYPDRLPTCAFVLTDD